MNRSNRVRDSIARRDLFGAVPAGLAIGSLLAAPAAEAAPHKGKKFDPLENFKYDINASEGWVGAAGSAKEATVEEFPASKSIAGVAMRLKPGGLRELHWHSIAAEWAYVIEGNVRTTVISPDGQAEQSDFGPGDTWYFPKGHGHSLQGMGPGEAYFILGFDDGHFSEFGTFSVTDWLARTPAGIVARNTGLAVSEIAALPKEEAYIVPGKVPGPIPASLRGGDVEPGQLSHKYSLAKRKPVVFPGGEERVVSSREFPIQTTLTAARLDLKPGSLREMHWHPNADEWQFYVSGKARVGIFGAHGRSAVEEFGPGQIAFIQQGFGHYIETVGDEPLQVVILFNSPVYREISLSSWLAANPAQVLADNFGLSREQIARLPSAQLGIVEK